MTPAVYENLSQLSYRELLGALSNIKEKESELTTLKTTDAMSYKDAIIMELDKRQRDM